MKVVSLGSHKILVDNIGQKCQIPVQDVAWIEPAHQDGQDAITVYRKSDPSRPATLIVDDEGKEIVKRLVMLGELPTELAPEAKAKWDEELAHARVAGLIA